MMMLPMMMTTVKHHFQAYRFFSFCWNSFGMMVTHLAWTPYWHSSQPWPPLCNLLLLHPQTERPLLPHLPLLIQSAMLSRCSSLIMNILSKPFRLWKMVSLHQEMHLEMQLAITSTSGTEKGRHLPTTSYTTMLLPVSFHCLLVRRSSCTLCPKFPVPSMPDKQPLNS